MPFQFIRQEIPDVILVEPKVFGDERGFFLESYEFGVFSENGIREIFMQDNHSKSVKNVFRGLHYQNPPFEQSKLVRVISGEIIDFAVDIRQGSPYYGKYVGVPLSSENKNMLYVPKGFAHGFFVVSDTAEVLYKAGKKYNPKAEFGVIWNDPAIGLKLPVSEPILSDKDKKWPTLDKITNSFVYKL